MPVIDGQGRICGIITESDFAAKTRGFPFPTCRCPQVLGQWLPRGGLKRIDQAARPMTDRKIASREPFPVRENDSWEEILRRMLRYDIHRPPVVRDGVPVGMVARHDLLRPLLRDDPDSPPAGASCGGL